MTELDLNSRYYTITTKEFLGLMWKYIRPYKRRFFISTAARLIGESIYAINPYIYAVLITLIAKGAPAGDIYFYFSIWAAGYFVRIGGMRLGRWVGNRMGERIAINLELDGLDQLIKWPLATHENDDSGNKLKRVQKGSEGIKQIMRLWQDSWLPVFCHVFTMLTVVIFTKLFVGFCLMLFLISYYLISRPLLARAGYCARQVNKKEEEVGGLIFEIINNVRTTKVMQLYPWLRERLYNLTIDLYKRIEKRSSAFQGAGLINSSFAQVVRLVFVGYIIYGVINGNFTLSFLLMFIMYFNNLRDSTEKFAESLEDYAIARHHLARFNNIKEHIFDLSAEETFTYPTNWEKIIIKKLSFAYGNNQVLSNLNFTINRGERVGIVGLSGAGKSTLFKLLLKEHNLYTGDIFFDNIPLNKINTLSLINNTAVVLQDTEVFNLTLEENIILSSTKHAGSEKKLEKALEVSHVREFAEKLPHKLSTLIGEKGVKLSGGERQRVGIARAIFKDPQILFLDEATSHLDVESEEKIQDSLRRFFKEVTAIVIAHRLTTIKEMDRIIVIDEGKIVEEGSFAELYKQKGKFFDLWEKQKL